MADCEIPLRNGGTLGDYHAWSFELWQSLLRCNEEQRVERDFYRAIK